MLILIGDLIIPVSLILLTWKENLVRDNYTGLANRSPALFAAIALLCFGGLLWELAKIGRRRWPKKYWQKQMLVETALILAAALVPYPKAENFWSGLHVLLGYSAFVYLNILLWQLGWDRPVLRGFYLAALGICLSLCILAMSVTGLAETVYACMTSILLVRLDLSTQQ